eukprot:TRINITY_DN63237_c0_g1_i1.p1 TRINITY_DN63237_c0_g1~~TRINITY_DN63237_c0_g1_i1.p1  ORF type:complete len:122 (+),score=6.52 TRINITY_DN63237_c0_g1_i1:110-475(+)
MTAENSEWFPPTELFQLPPFFTIQPNKATREKQLSLWLEVVLSYCAFHSIHFITVGEGTTLEKPFRNVGIKSIVIIINCVVFEDVYLHASNAHVTKSRKTSFGRPEDDFGSSRAQQSRGMD